MPLQLYLSAPILVDRGYDYQTKDGQQDTHMNIKRVFLLLLAPLFLAACEQDRITAICEDTPQYCVELHHDSWCRFERTALIRARRQQATVPGDESDYHLMQTLQQYHDCLEPLLAIEYTRRKERKNDKLEAVIHARDAISQLTASTAQSDYPHLLLWHWQYQGSQRAKARFIKLANRPEMQQPDLQKALAELLTLRDSQAAEQALHHALALYDKDADIDTDIIANLLTLYIREKRYQEVWVWSRVLNQLGHEEQVSLDRMNVYAHFNASQQQQMQQQVEDILEQLAAGTYHRKQ